MKLFDTHAHIGLIYSDAARQMKVIMEAKAAGVQRIVSINNSLFDFEKTYNNIKFVSGIYHAVGVAPVESAHPGAKYVDMIEKFLTYKNVVAVGETGLDYQKEFGDKKTQIELFITQLDIAREHKLPVIIHNREAGADILEILKTRCPPRGAIFHCYSENAEFARRCMDLPVWFSFAGNLTYRYAKNLHETAMNVPLERILIETESPFMIPSEFREKKRTMPAYITSTANFLAELLDKPLEEVTEQLWKNSCKVFGLGE